MEQKLTPALLRNPHQLIFTHPFGPQVTVAQAEQVQQLIGTDPTVKLNIEVFQGAECHKFKQLDIFLGWNIPKILQNLPGKFKPWSNCWQCNAQGERVSDQWPFEFTGIQWVWNSEKWELNVCSKEDGVLRVLLE